nr:hypothetical protein [Saprospiraceae bacterium]
HLLMVLPIHDFLNRKVLLKPNTVHDSIFFCSIYLESTCVNEDILEKGLAWYFPTHDNCDDWSETYRKTKSDKIGIWSLNEDEIKPPLELRKIMTQKEYFEKYYVGEIMPYLLFHNPYDGYSASITSGAIEYDSGMSAAREADYYRDRYIDSGKTSDLLNFQRAHRRAMDY